MSIIDIEPELQPLISPHNTTIRLNNIISKIEKIINENQKIRPNIEITIYPNTYYYYPNKYCYVSCCASCCACCGEYSFDFCCCINYNPLYRIETGNVSSRTRGFGRCCNFDIFQNDNFKIGFLICFIPCITCLPICLIDLWCRQCYGVSATGFFEYCGDCALECCVCDCWENCCYLNIIPQEMEEVYLALVKKYNRNNALDNALDNALEIQLKKYQKDIDAISAISIKDIRMGGESG